MVWCVNSGSVPAPRGAPRLREQPRGGRRPRPRAREEERHHRLPVAPPQRRKRIRESFPRRSHGNRRGSNASQRAERRTSPRRLKLSRRRNRLSQSLSARPNPRPFRSLTDRIRTNWPFARSTTEPRNRRNYLMRRHLNGCRRGESVESRTRSTEESSPHGRKPETTARSGHVAARGW